MYSEIRIEIPNFRRFDYVNGSDEHFYMSNGVVTRNGKPFVNVSRWEVDDVLVEIEEKYDVLHPVEGDSDEGSTFKKEKYFTGEPIHLPTLHESMVASTDRGAHKSIFSYPAEWQRNLILGPHAPAETGDYVILNHDGRTLKPLKDARNIIPLELHYENGKRIITADVFRIPFELKDGRFDPEDVHPKTGFLKKQPTKKGKYRILFGKDKPLYGGILRYDDSFIFGWEPARVSGGVGFRGCTKEIPEELLE